MLRKHIPHLVKTIYKGFKRYKKSLLLLFILGFFGGLLETIGINALIPLFSFILHDTPTQFNALTNITQNVFLFFHLTFTVKTLLIFISVLFISKSIFLLAFQFLHSKIIADYEYHERNLLFKKILSTEWSYLLTQKMGHLDKVLTQDISYATLVLRDTGQIILVITNLLIYITVAVSISPFITFITLITGTIFFIGFKPLFQKTSKTSRRFIEENKKVAHFINQITLGIKSIKTLAKATLVINESHRLFEMLKKLRMKLHFYAGLGTIFAQPMIVIFLLSLFAISYKLSDFNFGTFTVTIYLVNKIFTYIESAQKKIQSLSEYTPFLESAITYTAKTINHQEKEVGDASFVFQKSITLTNIEFEYSNERKILKGINLTIQKGEMIGIIGPSGSGKTTIIDLLLRLFTPSSGTITIDNKNIETVGMQEWRRNVCYVPQDIFLLNDTIENNIRFFDDTVSETDIRKAATMSYADEFIAKEPYGLQTLVGERGVNLSVGQRQRIVLARALARKPNVLILDEATSALDHESEGVIKEALLHLKGKLTIIMVAHKPSTLALADRIVTMTNGEIIEVGTPLELEKNPSSFYANMQKTSM